jgi:signal transduction histidine kinase/ligand-binding sensor domain-containing protein
MKFINHLKARFIKVLLLSYLGFILNSEAQHINSEPGIAPTTPLENCSVDQWTGDNGLLSNNLTSVFQAADGFLWITTNNGLMRFDGMHLDIYNQEVVPFLATDAFYRIYQDKNKVLWFASRGSGIVKYSDNVFSQHLPNNKLIPKSLRTMLVQDDGTIWAGSDNKGLIQIKDTTARKIDHPLLEGVIIMTLDAGPDNSIYIGTNSKGLLIYKNGNIEQLVIDNSVSYSANAVKLASDGKLFIGTTEGLYIKEGEQITSVDFLDNIQVNHIITDSYGSVWIATERGLARINEKNNTKEFLRSGKNFRGAHITSLCIDKEGSLWLSTGKSGLLRMKESLIRNYSEVNGLSVDRVNVVTEGPDGKFYICLDDGFVNIIENGKITPLEINEPGWNESVRDIFIEQNGTAWIASYNGLIKKTGEKEKLFTTDNGLPSNSVRRIFRDKKGATWLGTRTGGIAKMINDKVEKIYNRKNGLSSEYILAIEQDKEGRMIIGTHSGGLNIIHTDDRIETFHINGDDDGVLIFNVHIDEAGDLWLATTIGLYHFDLEKRAFTKLAITDVVKGESYFDWVEDKQGSIWIPTNIGIIELAKKDVRSFLAKKVPSIKSKLYNNFDGMRNKECTGATRSTLSSTGEVWVPTIQGICILNPERKGINKIVPPVYITEIITDKEVTQNPTEPVIVEPGNFRVTIKFTALSLLAPNKVKFRYMIQGIDPGWMDAQPRTRSVDYTNLPPGKYVFSVMASNNDGIWNEKGIQVPIEVRPFFYETFWFYFLLLLFFVVVFYAIYKWRVKAVEHKNSELIKVNSELDRFVYSASHDLRAPLASILGLVKLTRIDTDPEHRLQYLDKVEKSIHKLDGFIHDIINYSRNARTEIESHPVDFNLLIHDLLEGLKYQEKSERIRKDVQIAGDGVFQTDIKRLNIVLYNLVTNAIKYHNLNREDPFIRIQIDYTRANANIEISDNGIGIDQQHLDNIFKMFYRADERSSGSGLGLFIAKEAIEKLNGTLTVRSEVGKGSTFIVRIPTLRTSKQSTS